MAVEIDQPHPSLFSNSESDSAVDSDLRYDRNLDWANPAAGSLLTTTDDITKDELLARRENSLDEISRACESASNLDTLWPSILCGISNGNGDIAFAALYRAETTIERVEGTSLLTSRVNPLSFLLSGTVGSFPAAPPCKLEPNIDQKWVQGFFRSVNTHAPVVLQAKDGTLPLEMQQASKDRCYGDACHQAVVLPSAWNRITDVHAVLIVGLAPRVPYDRSYQAWIKTLHREFSNEVVSWVLEEGRHLAEKNEDEGIGREIDFIRREKALEQQEATVADGGVSRLLKIMGAASVGVFECSLSGHVLQVNEGFCDLSGCSRELNVDNQPKLVDLCDAEDAPVLSLNWQALLAGLPATLSIRFRLAGGMRKWVQIACVPVFDSQSVVIGVTGCATDIDAQKKVEHEAIFRRTAALEQLHLSELRLRNLVENAPLGILIFDRDMRPSFANKTWFKMTSHSTVPAADIDVRSVIFHEDLPQFDERLHDISRTGESATFHLRLNRLWIADSDFSQQTWVQFTAFLEMVDNDNFQITSTIMDISDFKFSEALQLRRLEQAVEAKRQQENFIDMVSHEIRNPLNVVMHCADSIAHSLSEVKLLLDRHDSGSMSDLESASAADNCRSLNDNMVDAVETITSCTMHQTRIIDDILSLSKLDSDLLEICPTIFQVKSFLGRVESTFKLDAEQAGVQLLAVADPSLSKLGVDWIDADPGRITQVLFNLVANAIKFTKDTPGEKAVSVRIGAACWPPTAIFDGLIKTVQKPVQTDQSALETEPSAGSIFLWFKVEDTGCGMDEAAKARVATQFTQASPKTHSKYGGSGLGLSISQKLAALLGGEIGFNSQQHVGSTFAFYTRASRALRPNSIPSTLHSNDTVNTEGTTLEHPHAMSTTADAPSTTPSSILLVEDNLINQRVLKKQLQRHGYIVHTADNGQEAFDFIKTTQHWKGATASAPRIDVILMDIEMPIVNGLECASMIRAAQHDGSISKHLHIIAVTANARPEQLKRAKETGMDDAVPKPFRVKDLAAVIEQLKDG